VDPNFTQAVFESTFGIQTFPCFQLADFPEVNFIQPEHTFNSDLIRTIIHALNFTSKEEEAFNGVFLDTKNKLIVSRGEHMLFVGKITPPIQTIIFPSPIFKWKPFFQDIEWNVGHDLEKGILHLMTENFSVQFKRNNIPYGSYEHLIANSEYLKIFINIDPRYLPTLKKTLTTLIKSDIRKNKIVRINTTAYKPVNLSDHQSSVFIPGSTSNEDYCIYIRKSDLKQALSVNFNHWYISPKESIIYFTSDENKDISLTCAFLDDENLPQEEIVEDAPFSPDITGDQDNIPTEISSQNA